MRHNKCQNLCLSIQFLFIKKICLFQPAKLIKDIFNRPINKLSFLLEQHTNRRMIQDFIVNGFFNCSLKTFFLRNQFVPIHNEYHKEIEIIENGIKTKLIRKWQQAGVTIVYNFPKLYEERLVVVLTNIEIDGVEIKIPFLEFYKQTVVPIFISYDSSISKEKKSCFSYKSSLIATFLNTPIERFKVIRSDFKIRNFKTTNIVPTSKIVEAINSKQVITKKKHCAFCEFQGRCEKELSEKNDLRLLSSITEEEVIKWNEKGYFSIIQLSYKFKPRKNRILPKKSGRYKFELKALAIKEGKTFVLNPPKITTDSIAIYFDFESLPSENLVYLIGLVITENNRIKTRYSFWADNNEEESLIFERFFRVINSFPNSILYHYGSFEIKELLRFNKKNDFKYEYSVTDIVAKSINVLSFFYSDIYPPTFSNRLKEIANYIGFKWRKVALAGLNSIAYRKKWERTRRKKLKNYLIEYNQEDCEGLFRVTGWLKNISIEKEQNILKATDIAKQGSLMFGKPDFIIDAFNNVNDKAYFNYQHSKIYFRANKKKNKSVSRKSTQYNIKPNTTFISERPNHCEKCNNPNLYIHQKYDRTLIDLKFSKNGIKRWVTNFKSYRFRCSHCGNVFTDPKYYKQPTYGRNIQIWIIYNYMTYGISYGNLTKMLSENFNIVVTSAYVSSMKARFAEKFAYRYSNILETIIKGEVIHIDETSVRTRGVKGYVWVLTNFTKVYYIYRENRETGFLIDLFKDFKGILISDFYTGYDSLKCKQQKCLIHLMRDINDVLFKNQQNLELELIARQFGDLMRIIVSCIDSFGLKAKYLKPYNNQVDKFFKLIESNQFKTEIARKLKTRLLKNRERLFLFLNYDNIPWNNNNAEFAIKAFARYRKQVDGIYNCKGLTDYLILLSISQSFHYDGKSFIEFLKTENESS